MNSVLSKELSCEQADFLQIIHWLIRMRWLAGAGVIITTLISKYRWNIEAGYFPIWILTGILLLYNSGFAAGEWWLNRRPERLPQKIDLVRCCILFQIALDLVVLTLMLHFAGGVENPLIFFYIFHTTIASVMLSSRDAYMFGFLAVGLAIILFVLEYNQIIPHYHLEGFLDVELYRERPYVLGVGVILTTTLMTSVYLASSIAQRLRQREMELEQTRQSLLEESRTCELSLLQLNQLHREKSEFVRKVAHELRAPLAAIKSCLQVAREYYPEELTGKPREMTERAERRADGLTALVKDLLNLSRATELSATTPDFEPVQLDKLLSAVIEFYQPEAQEQGIKIVSQLESAVEINADIQGMEEVFNNLLSNGIKYSPKDTQITVSLKADEEWAYICFADQGIGIIPEDMPLLFSEFFRAKNAKALHVEGTGLGLALCKRIVEAHGGEISVDSKPGKGSSFKIKLRLPPRHGTKTETKDG
jgi:signal transduction histidine kinase